MQNSKNMELFHSSALQNLMKMQLRIFALLFFLGLSGTVFAQSSDEQSIS